MTDQPGGTPEERLPARRPPSEAAPADRFTAPRQAHQFELTPERAAAIVRQSSSARAIGLLATTVVVLFVILYYFYELGAPLGISTARLDVEIEHQQVVAVERGYNLYQANCARCHGVDGEGGIGPVLNRQDKLYQHLNAAYLETILEVGGRYACGNADSIMPVWSDENGGPLNYRQIEELVAFLTATSDHEYEIRDPELNEPLHDPETGEILTFHGWRDPAYTPAPDATPYPACWQDEFGGGETPPPAGTPPPDAVTIPVVATGIKFDVKELTAPAGEEFVIAFDNQDASVPHDVDIRTPDGTTVADTPTINGVSQTTYTIPALEAGEYVFICSVHPIPDMTGTLTVE